MYLVFTTNWGHKNKNYIQIRNNNNNVYTIKICSMYKLYTSKTVGIKKVVSKNCKGYSSYCCSLRVTLGLFS